MLNLQRQEGENVIMYYPDGSEMGRVRWVRRPGRATIQIVFEGFAREIAILRDNAKLTEFQPEARP